MALGAVGSVVPDDHGPKRDPYQGACGFVSGLLAADVGGSTDAGPPLGGSVAAASPEGHAAPSASEVRRFTWSPCPCGIAKAEEDSPPATEVDSLFVGGVLIVDAAEDRVGPFGDAGRGAVGVPTAVDASVRDPSSVSEDCSTRRWISTMPSSELFILNAVKACAPSRVVFRRRSKTSEFTGRTLVMVIPLGFMGFCVTTAFSRKAGRESPYRR